MNKREVIIFGANCGKCKKTESLIRSVILKNNFPVAVHKSENWEEMILHNITYLPTVVIDGKIRFKGIVPGEIELIKYLK